MNDKIYENLAESVKTVTKNCVRTKRSFIAKQCDLPNEQRTAMHVRMRTIHAVRCVHVLFYNNIDRCDAQPYVNNY